MPGRRRLLLWLVGLVLLVVGIGLLLLLPRRAEERITTLEPTPTGTLNILIIGKDARAVGPVLAEGRRRNVREERSHSDIIVVAHINFRRGRLNLVAIPRDLLVEVPGVTRATGRTDFTNMEKITHTYAIGGEKLLRRTVENLLGIKIQRSIAFDFDSFRMAFDLLRPYLGVLRVGTTTLTERDQALQFARKRYGLQFDDADRCRNAVNLIRAVIIKTWWLANTRLGDILVARLLRIVGEDTDLTADEIDAMMVGLRRAGFRPGRIRNAVLVGSGADVTLSRYNQTLSCYLPVYAEIEKQVQHFLFDRDEVRALDFMTQQPFRVPGYFEYNYVIDTLAPAMESVVPVDSQADATLRRERERARAVAPPPDSGK